MAERKRITLVYEKLSAWIGGTYYILNIIKALNGLSDSEKPQLTILVINNSDTNDIADINYPYINYIYESHKFIFVQKLINKLSRELLDKNLVFFKLPYREIENVYPYYPIFKQYESLKFAYWITDFQQHYLPHFFTKYELQVRSLLNKLIVKSKRPVVFSSNNALNDFDKFYPENENKKYVVPFKSFISDAYKLLNIDLIKNKYKITDKYFIVSNQFWSHKNHIVVLKAAKKLKEQGFKVQIVLTGKEHDYRNPEYSQKLRSFVEENNLNDDILFLGLIDRDEQLLLLKNSIAIIQPSLFEGWSTVVEDAKALSKFIILSGIPLHREQIQNNCLFFEPNDENMLLEHMLAILKGEVSEEIVDYSLETKAFAQLFLQVFND